MTRPHHVSDSPTSRPTRIQSVARASQILMAIARAKDGLAATQVARQFSLSQPTAYHLLATLADEGLVAKNSSRRYLLGPGAAVIASAVAAQDAPPLEYLRMSHRVANRTHETVYLSAWRGSQIRVLDTIEGSHVLRVAGSTDGYTKFTHARASAKVLLAHASKEVQDRVISAMTFERVTATTITSEREYRQQLAEVLTDGFGYDREEFHPGVVCISAPIWERGQVNAAVTVGMPTFRLEDKQSDVKRVLVEVLGSFDESNSHEPTPTNESL